MREKCECLDSDPHFWMPFTLKRDNYVAVMAKKDTEPAVAGGHYDRMLAFRMKFQPVGGMLGCVDVGRAAYWCGARAAEHVSAHSRRRPALRSPCRRCS